LIFHTFTAILLKKTAEKSVNYNRFINKDFRSFAETDKPRRHPALRWGLFAAGCAVITVVIANTRDNSSNDIVIDHSKEHNESLQPATADIQNTSIKLKLPLPASRQSTDQPPGNPDTQQRSEERRVGQECRPRGSPEHQT